MTVTLPDGALAAAIAAIAGVVVWAVRLIANTHVDTLKKQAKASEDILPIVQRMDKVIHEHIEMERQQGRELVRLRRVIRRINPSALVCEDCHGWLGNADDKPETMELCDCSDPNPDTTGRFAPVSVATPPGGIPRVRPSKPGKSPKR